MYGAGYRCTGCIVNRNGRLENMQVLAVGKVVSLARDCSVLTRWKLPSFILKAHDPDRARLRPWHDQARDFRSRRHPDRFTPRPCALRKRRPAPHWTTRTAR